MDHLRRTTCPEGLKATLNCYQLSSVDSLSGPNGFPAQAAQMWFKENKQLPPNPPQPLMPVPYFITSDKTSTRSETTLCGESITCFLVGGEKRLCLPQILTSVLREFSIADINQACAELHIFCSRCTADQLEILKVLGILPLNTAQCGLITKTDAERLVSGLFEEQPQGNSTYTENLTKNLDGMPVRHECFGRCDGLLYREFYSNPASPCIICKECKAIFTPKKFVLHTHRGFEKRTCHWGFDPENWRSYLILPTDIMPGKKRTEFEKCLDNFKLHFTPSSHNYLNQSPNGKQKQHFEIEGETAKDINNEAMIEAGMIPRVFPGLPFGLPTAVRPSAFRPWSPCLPVMSQMDLPLLQGLPHLKTQHSIPFTFDRNLFPQYLQSGTPVIMRSSEAAERQISPSKSTSGAPNVCLAAQKPAPCRHSSHETDVELDKQKSTKNLSNSWSKLSSPPPLIPTDKLMPESIKVPAEIQRPLSRSREAAAAMLELKSAGSFCKTAPPTKSTAPPPPAHNSSLPPSQTLQKSNSDPVESSCNASTSTVIPLDQSRQHYKWVVNGCTYIISAAGVNELDYLQGLINNSNKADSRTTLMHELVKMKSRFEEKLDIRTRVKRDLEMELDHVRSRKRQQISELKEDKRKIRQDLDDMRYKYCKKIDELNSEKQSLRDKLNAIGANKTIDIVESDLEKKVESLRTTVHQLETANDSLRLALHDEREKRRNCELKLEEDNVGRISFLTESPLARMVRTNATKANESNDVNNNGSPRKHKSSSANYISMLAGAEKAPKKKQRLSSQHTVDEEEIIVE